VKNQELRRLFFNIAVNDFCRIAAFSQRFLNRFRHHHGAVLAAGAAERDGEIAFAFAHVVRNQIDQKAFHATEKFVGLRKGTDVAANFGIFSGEGAQARDKVRIGKKANVEDQVSVGGNAVAVAEAYDRYEHRVFIGILKARSDEGAQFVNVESR